MFQGWVDNLNGATGVFTAVSFVPIPSFNSLYYYGENCAFVLLFNLFNAVEINRWPVLRENMRREREQEKENLGRQNAGNVLFVQLIGRKWIFEWSLWYEQLCSWFHSGWFSRKCDHRCCVENRYKQVRRSTILFGSVELLKFGIFLWWVDTSITFLILECLLFSRSFQGCEFRQIKSTPKLRGLQY